MRARERPSDRTHSFRILPTEAKVSAPTPSGAERPIRVLVVSTSLGSGHNGNAEALVVQLETNGHAALVIDHLALLPWRIGRLVRRWYRFQLRYLPGSYERSWQTLNRLHRIWAVVNGALCRRRLLALLAIVEPDVVVANNPLGAQTIGHLRRKRAITVPAVTFVTDFGVHELWVHPSVDFHLCVHPCAVDEVIRLDGQQPFVTGPLVDPVFHAPRSRQEALAAAVALGHLDGEVGPGTRLALITGGSWGVGGVEETARFLAACGWQVIVACGTDSALRGRLHGTPRISPIGWTNDMANLVAAADVIVENAGGLSAMEAFAARRPVVTYAAIPGHGRHNAKSMEQAGVVDYARTHDQLHDAMAACVDGSSGPAERVERAQAMFVGGAVTLLVDAARTAATARSADCSLTPRKLGRRRSVTRLAIAAAAYVAATSGVSTALAAGVPLTPQLRPGSAQAFVAVRLTDAQLHDPAIFATLATGDIGVVVDETTAAHSQDALEALRARGIPIASSSSESVTGALKDRFRGHRRVPRSWLATNQVATVIVGRVDIIDVSLARRSGTRLAVAHDYRVASTRSRRQFRKGSIYIVDERRSTIEATESHLTALRRTIAMQSVPVTALDRDQRSSTPSSRI
jgi:processive 1,2-diacylglycerol beta-glucosyltransferase